MMDREKVISDLEEQIAWIRDNDFHKFPGWGHSVLAMRDALELLKAQEQHINELHERITQLNRDFDSQFVPYKMNVQEQIEPHLSDDGLNKKCFECGACGYPLSAYSVYCQNCGRAVKWDD